MRFAGYVVPGEYESMKCECRECDGTGMIECPECKGEGEIVGKIEKATLHKSLKHYDELKELQKDAIRCIKQADRLKQLNPKWSGNYTEQLLGCLSIINKQADRIAAK